MSEERPTKISTDLEPCPVCGGTNVSQDADLKARDRIRCETCKLDFRRRDLGQSRP